MGILTLLKKSFGLLDEETDEAPEPEYEDEDDDLSKELSVMDEQDAEEQTESFDWMQE